MIKETKHKSRALIHSIIHKFVKSKLYVSLSDFVSDVKDFFSRKHYYSLTVELAASAVVGILISAVLYVVMQIGTSYFINLQLSTDSAIKEREQRYIDEISDFVAKENISLSETDKILERAKGINYYRIIIYTDVPTDDVEKTPATREQMAEYAQKSGMYLVDLSDGSIIISINDFSEFYYYNVSSAVNFVVALIVLAIFLINTMRRIIRQINRLESDVAVVSYSDANHTINVEGSNNIAKLSANVETMRQSMLENLRKEQEARNANTELITSLSHDIRTPLTVILGYLDMMRNKTKDADMEGYIDVTEKTAMRLKQLSDDMFKYFLVYGNTAENVTTDEYDARTLLEQMLSEHLVLLTESGYTVESSIDSDKLYDGIKIITDADNLMRIFDNVFSNLYKYADKSEPITVSASLLGDFIEVIFKNKILSDTGGAESNKIGLRTCSRLAEFIAESFEYSAEDGVFTTRLVLKTAVSTAFDVTLDADVQGNGEL